MMPLDVDELHYSFLVIGDDDSLDLIHMLCLGSLLGVCLDYLANVEERVVLVYCVELQNKSYDHQRRSGGRHL